MAALYFIHILGILTTVALEFIVNKDDTIFQHFDLIKNKALVLPLQHVNSIQYFPKWSNLVRNIMCTHPNSFDQRSHATKYRCGYSKLE